MIFFKGKEIISKLVVIMYVSTHACDFQIAIHYERKA